MQALGKGPLSLLAPLALMRCSSSVFLPSSSSSSSSSLSFHGLHSAGSPGLQSRRTATSLPFACSLVAKSPFKSSLESRSTNLLENSTWYRRASSLMQRHAMEGAEAIVSPQLPGLITIPRDKNNKDFATHQPPPLGNPLNFYLPPISCSTPAKLHPMYHLVRDTCDSWIISTLKPQNEAYKQFLIQSMHPLFVCLTIPDCIPERILAISKLISSFFVIDNFSDELLLLSDDATSEKEYYDLILSLFEGAPSFSNKEWSHGLKEMCEVLMHIWEDTKSTMPQYQQQRFIGFLSDLLKATLTQSQYREKHGVVDFHTYLSFRKYTGGGYNFIILAEFGMGLDLEEDVLTHPDIAKLQEIVAYHVSYVNDLLSFRKEFCLGHYQNLPSILCMHEGYNLQESIFRVCRMILGLDEEYLRFKNRVMLNRELVERKGVKEYLEALGYIMSGFLEWAYQTGRYHGLNNYLTLRHGLVSLVHYDRTIITQGAAKLDHFSYQ